MAAQLAVMRPRSEEVARSEILKCCSRKRFAEKARYKYPRGNTTVIGASVQLARELARLWGNIRYGVRIVGDDVNSRSIVGWAWDVQTNAYEESPDVFRKLIQRKQGKGENAPTVWVVPDERELRELTNRRAAICVRNCIVHLLPFDLLDEVQDACASTMRAEVEKDPDGAKRDVIDSFAGLGVPANELEEFVGHSLSSLSPHEVEDLRAIFRAIKFDGVAWAEYYRPVRETVTPNAETMGQFRGASAHGEERPGGDRHAVLPTSLRPDADDPRPMVEFLLEKIPVLDRSDRDKIAAALPGLRLEKKIDSGELMKILEALAAVEKAEELQQEKDALEAEVEKRRAAEETRLQVEAKRKEDEAKSSEPKPPQSVVTITSRMMAAKGNFVVEVQRKAWRDLVAAEPELEQWSESVEKVAVAALERLAAKKGG